MIQSIRSSLTSLTEVDKGKEMSNRNVGVIFGIFLFTFVLADTSQLIFALIGAVAYAILQAFTPRKEPRAKCKAEVDTHTFAWQDRPPRVQRHAWSQGRQPQRHLGKQEVRDTKQRVQPAILSAKPPEVKAEVYKPSSMPVLAPKFTSNGWDAEVTELLASLTPGPSEIQAVQRLASHVEQSIKSLHPDVEVTGFAHAGIACGKSFAIAVPEVDIVANISPAALSSSRQSFDMKKFQKSAVRSCTDRLVSNGQLKFRRSAFRGEEPKTTLLVPKELGIFNEAIPISFSINTVTPFYTAALVTECGQIDPRTKAVILLVKRWAKDRGICHSAKGHLSPYLWSILAMYFLQVGLDNAEGSLLPCLDDFKISSSLLPSAKLQPKRSTTPVQQKGCGEKLSVGQLLGKFFHFYSRSFDWNKEAVSVRQAKRAAPSLAMPLHVVVNNDGTSAVGPSIEDPFEPGSNLGACMNRVSLARLHEELARADSLYKRDGSLSELLEPWAPAEESPERSSGSGSQDEEQPAGKADSTKS